ncbi:MAG: AAA family ATPase [Brasilonema octagenarum HA4186-MV1]|jgi:predicted ATPase/signal transduction histidine kinase/CheY-like chemotaxis protein|nr:AAA family ATPase [Brasilonema octagenarum HA4186-MV1]
MISLPDITIVSKIYESANTLVYKAVFKKNQQPLILKLLKEDYPTPAELYRYQQEYEITSHLNLEGTIKAYELRKYQNTQFILLEDFGAESLKILLEQRPFSLAEFLCIAIQITNILGQLHQINIIHKDINPSNIVLNPQTGQLKLIDFGLSSIFLKENTSLKSPNVIEGTLAYISPEQTGRMNRSLDYRTDFYSLGVTFYELLTTQVPFESVDALELIHCHIAKQPIPPHAVNADIPLNISEIVMKLMAKTADERYQSAWGIKGDLETCLTQYQTGEIKTFTLGCQDINDNLQIPEKLYGRKSQIESLFTAFERVTQGQTELMLISGSAGIGKSALVQEIYQIITQKRGYFIAGKFDQLNRDIPYQALIAAFQELVRQLLTETEAQLQHWQQKIVAVLGVNAQIIIDVIPEIELIIGKQHLVPKLPPIEAQNRFNLVFQNLIQVCSQKQHPLVLFLDDLQWTDSATLQLLQQIMIHTNTKYLFLIGAYRDNEVSATHPVMLTLSEMNNQGALINHLSLSPLNLNQVNEFIADTLKAECLPTQRLAELVWEKTQGNPLFIKEFLKSLYTEKLLKYDSNSRAWSWDLKQIISRNITDNVVELMCEKIQSLSESTQNVLRLAACIGNQFDVKTLSIINEKPQKETTNELWDAMQAGLILPVGDDYKFLQTDRELNELKIIYKFAHDRIQQAAYSLIPPDNKQAVHWKVGQFLCKNTPQEVLQQKIFDIVNQLNFGIEAIDVQLEKDKLAQLNLMAGQKAKASAAWKPAWNYLRIGMNCLSVDSWIRQYDLTLTVYVEAAEAAILSGDFEEMERLAFVVLQQARTLLDKVKIYEVKIQACTVYNKPLEGIKTGLSVLKLLGISFPKKPNKLDILLELVRTKLALVGKRVEDLINLPAMTNPYKLAAMRILSRVASAAYFASPELLGLLVLKQVNLSLKYGNTSVSAYGYAAYGLILCGEAVGDIETGYQFGQLALRLLDKFNDKELKARTLFIVNYFINHWKEHLRNTLTPLLDAYSIGLETGDLEYAAYSACVYSYHSYVLGKDLATIEQEMATYSHTLSQLKQKTAFYYNQLNRQLVLNLIGRTEKKCSLIGESYDEIKMLPLHLEANAQNICHALYFYKLVLGYLFQDYQQALENAQLVEKNLDSALGTIPLSHFYNSLVHLAIYTDISSSEQKLVLHKVRSNQKKLKKWAYFAPMTHLHKFYLVEAERHRVSGKNLKAIDYYEKAIALAKQNEYLNEEALANELAAKFYLAWGKEKIAQTYFQEAHYCYELWGAIAKVEDLESRYPKFFQKVTTENTFIDTRTSLPNRSTGNNLESALDIATLMKASFAITSEIELNKLLSTLMKILLENAGAQTGYLILEKDGELRVEASGNTENEQITVLQSIAIETCLPTSIIYYVARTKETIVLGDAFNQIQNPHSQVETRKLKIQNLYDSYITVRQPKSILCFPVLNHGQLIGAVYLENNLATHVFTPQRLEIIQLLSTQAAIAITNARLYAQVQSNQNRLNQFLNAIPVGISIRDLTGKLIYTNQTSQQLLNIQDFPTATKEQLSEQYHVYRAGTGQIYPTAELPIMRSLGGEKVTADDLELHQTDRIIFLEVTSTPIFDCSGAVEYAIAVFQDITVRKQAEALMTNYNQTLELKVHERTTELAQANAQLESEVVTRLQTEAELAKAKELAEAANLAKSIFIANMSHELRTPLNAILGFSQLMNQDTNLSPKQQENLKNIHRSGEHLLTLINQVLDLSKIEAGRMTLSLNNFNLKTFLIDLENIFLLSAKDKGLQLQFECAADVDQYICTDEVKLRQVLINIIGNAIKFTDSGSVSVKVETGNRERLTGNTSTSSVHRREQEIGKNSPLLNAQYSITFEVQDTGIGIEPSEFAQLFQPFVQTTSGQKLQQGTGLGLVISRQFIRLMGGEITVISGGKIFHPENPIREFNDDTTTFLKAGTTFQFDIQVGNVEPSEIDKQPQKRRVISLAPNQPKYRLLVVDDDTYNRQLLVRLFQPVGFALQEATNGQEAIEIWESWSPHLIWMDMQMPVIDGFEATKRIKSTTKGQATVVIALSASALEEEKVVILSAGCDDFVRKPFQEQILFDVMKKYLGVSYLYEYIELSKRPGDMPEEAFNLSDLLAEMPKQWIVKLHDAALDADAELVARLIDEIPAFYSFEIMTLRDWMNKFQFDKILYLTE